jgi:hypothetical protein
MNSNTVSTYLAQIDNELLTVSDKLTGPGLNELPPDELAHVKRAQQANHRARRLLRQLADVIGFKMNKAGAFVPKAAEEELTTTQREEGQTTRARHAGHGRTCGPDVPRNGAQATNCRIKPKA